VPLCVVTLTEKSGIEVIAAKEQYPVKSNPITGLNRP